MKIISKISLTHLLFLVSFLLSSCGLMGIVSEEKLQKYNDKPDAWLCGKYYGLEYYTGNREFISNSDTNAAITILNKRKVKCYEHYNDLLKIDSKEKFVYLQKNPQNLGNQAEGAIVGSALCMAFAKNPKACTQGAAESLESDDERNRRIQNQNQQRIRQLELETQNQKRLLEENNQKKDMNEILRRCSPSGKFC